MQCYGVVYREMSHEGLPITFFTARLHYYRGAWNKLGELKKET